MANTRGRLLRKARSEAIRSRRIKLMRSFRSAQRAFVDPLKQLAERFSNIRKNPSLAFKHLTSIGISSKRMNSALFGLYGLRKETMPILHMPEARPVPIVTVEKGQQCGFTEVKLKPEHMTEFVVSDTIKKMVAEYQRITDERLERKCKKFLGWQDIESELFKYQLLHSRKPIIYTNKDGKHVLRWPDPAADPEGGE